MSRLKEWMMKHPNTACYIAVVVTINFLVSILQVVLNH